jgi:hypothetical protein
VIRILNNHGDLINQMSKNQVNYGDDLFIQEDDDDIKWRNELIDELNKIESEVIRIKLMLNMLRCNDLDKKSITTSIKDNLMPCFDGLGKFYQHSAEITHSTSHKNFSQLNQIPSKLSKRSPIRSTKAKFIRKMNKETTRGRNVKCTLLEDSLKSKLKLEYDDRFKIREDTRSIFAEHHIIHPSCPVQGTKGFIDKAVVRFFIQQDNN